MNYVLGKIDVDHKTSVTYKNGVLQESFMRTDKNGKVDQFCSVSYDGQTYKIQTEKEKLTHTRPITASVVTLYFKEPIGLAQIQHLKFYSIKISNAESVGLCVVFGLSA